MDNNYPLQMRRLPCKEIIEENEAGMFSIITKIKAQTVDILDAITVDEVIRVAYEEGITHLFLLDRDFVIRALKNEIERWKKDNE